MFNTLTMKYYTDAIVRLLLIVTKVLNVGIFTNYFKIVAQFDLTFLAEIISVKWELTVVDTKIEAKTNHGRREKKTTKDNLNTQFHRILDSLRILNR